MMIEIKEELAKKKNTKNQQNRIKQIFKKKTTNKHKD
jgi:hypothetical protein